MVTLADLNYRLTLPDADVRSLVADDQLREVNIRTLRRFDQVRPCERHVRNVSALTRTCPCVAGLREEDEEGI